MSTDQGTAKNKENEMEDEETVSLKIDISFNGTFYLINNLYLFKQVPFFNS